MKNIKNLIKTIIFNIALGISKTFKLSYHQGIGEFYSYSFFLDFGPKILIIRNSKVFFLGNAFSLEANLDKDGNILFILPRFMTTQKNDLVLILVKTFEPLNLFKRLFIFLLLSI